MSSIRLSPYRSQAERDWALVGSVLIEETFQVAVTWWSYEAIKLALGNAWYMPDFIYWLADGRIILVEVKGSNMQKGYRDSRTRQSAAAGLFPLFTFVEAMAAGNRDFSLHVWPNKKISHE